MSQFQTQVNVQPAPAQAGDFASANPRASVLAGPGSLVAGAAGVFVGRFAWAASNGLSNINTGEADAYNSVNSFGAGLPSGFVHREQQALITAFLSSNSYLVPQGYPLTLHSAGDFWVLNDGTAAATAGMKAYANNSNGKVSFAATGTPTAGASATAATLAKIVSATTGATLPTTNTCTASIAGTTMTVSALGAATMAVGPGQVLTGTGVAAGTTVVAQLTGTTGSTGTYSVNISQTVASTTVTMSGGTMILTGANTSGVFAVGQTLAVASSGSLTAGTKITSVLTGTGGAGIYLTNQVAATAVTAGTMTAANAMFLTVDATSTGTWGLDDVVTGATVGAGTTITATGAQNPNLTGLGGAGTYLTDTYQTAITAQTFGVYSNVETKWVCMSNGGAGELVKISSWALG